MSKTAQDAVWADLMSRDLERLFAQAAAIGWRPAVDEFAARAPIFVRRMRSTNLGNWHVLFGQSPDGRAVDVGCGFGSLLLGLGRYYARAIGVDYLPERVRFGQLRAQQDGSATTRFLRGNGLQLPVADHTCDLVTMNGVLEWAGYYESHSRPGALQLRMLSEARRLLAPTGHLAVAIENRYALEVLLGMPDTHTGLHFVPALPRRLADILSRVMARQPYRTFLYSLWGYPRLMRTAGFKEARVFDLVSSYNAYDFVVDVRDSSSYGFLYRHNLVRGFFPPAVRVRRLLARVAPRALGFLSYAYLVVAGEGAPTLLDPRHEVWRDLCAKGMDDGYHRFACQSPDEGAICVVLHDGRRAQGILEVAARFQGGTAESPEMLADRVLEAIAPRGVSLAATSPPGAEPATRMWTVR